MTENVWTLRPIEVHGPPQTPGLVSLGGGVWLPPLLVVRVDAPSLDVLVTVTVETGDDGKPRCTAATVESRAGEGLNGNDLRVPLTTIVERIVRVWQVRQVNEPAAAPGEHPELGVHVFEPSHHASSLADRAAHRTRQSRRAITTERLAKVAQEYVTALNEERPTADAIASRWDVSESTARRWVQKAREHDPPLLTDTEERQAGGHLTAHARRMLDRIDGEDDT